MKYYRASWPIVVVILRYICQGFGRYFVLAIKCAEYNLHLLNIEAVLWRGKYSYSYRSINTV